jgi:hypothetical protein
VLPFFSRKVGLREFFYVFTAISSTSSQSVRPAPQTSWFFTAPQKTEGAEFLHFFYSFFTMKLLFFFTALKNTGFLWFFTAREMAGARQKALI